ncbi:TadE/TadG family type IV pilus assembly protein [Paenibacillus sp. RC84]|uniref:TadE/TadG family type IV pilus assembly protein n=1 Tax=Paenibacillus sp. RC84 TaxID=3156252 RepID=UPI0035167E53
MFTEIRKYGVQIRLFRSQSGNFTLEGTLLFPVVILITLTLIIFGMFVYNRVALQQQAGVASERAAFSWNNSRKDPATGAFTPGAGDGLYWRLTQDGILGIFGYSGKTSVFQVPGTSDGSGPAGKLSRAAALLPPGVHGSMSYVNHIWERKVSAELVEPFRTRSFMPGNVIRDQVTGQGISHVVDPVELIRTVDLTRSYIPAIKNRITASKAREVLTEPAPEAIPPTSVITSEAQASAYIRKLVSGRKTEVITPEGDKRTIDALDASGTAHLAFYTFNEKNLKEQMRKDVLLKKEGTQVKGIVWHFFKTKSGKAPSQAIQRELAQNGISVILHE